MIKRTSLLLCLSAQPLAGWCDETHQLDDITVYARPHGLQSLQHITQPVSVLSGDELEQRQSSSIGETLSDQLGVTASDFGQGSSRPVIRGLGGPRLRVLQGGIGSMDVSTISVDHNISVSPFNVDQIEILRGPATLLYGSGASAGVVNIVNNRIPEILGEFATELNYRYDSATTGSAAALKVDGSLDQFALHGDFLKLENNNYEAEVGKIHNSAIETDDINLGGSYIGDWGFLGVSFGRYTSVYGVPFNPEEPDEQVSINLEQNRYDVAGQLNDPLPGFNNIRLRAAHNEYTHTEFEDPATPGTQFFNDEWEGRLEASHNPLGPWSGVVGLQLRNRSFAAVGDEAFVPPAKLNSAGFFLFEEMDLEAWHFEAGGRYEFQTVEPTATTGLGEIDHDTWSISLGTLYHFTDTLRLGVNVGRSQRAPALEELLATGPHLATETFEIGDAGLDAETTNNVDISLGHDGEAWSWKVNLFANAIEDYIYQQSQDTNGDGIADEVDETGALGGELLLVRFEQADALFYGAELETTYHLLLAEDHHLDFRLFTDMVRGELDGGEDLPRISPARLGFGIDYGHGRWDADLDIINVFEQDDTATLETGTGGYVLLNAGAGYTFMAGALESRIFLRGNNLLDQDARRHTSFIKDRAPLPGRSAMAGVRFRY